ncbi:uncharacterized protein LOC128673255 [Plodia interpunctella]|uniref:uncharacterized protein LOC128673255 n=1 Tax=Plodia interpunctella TaxID=58824 RepID=UPI0031012528
MQQYLSVHNTTQTTMFKLVVLSVFLAAATAKPSAIAPWGLGLAGLGAPLLGAHLAAPLAPVVSAPVLGAYNYRGPLSLGPGQPANIVAADGRPLDTLSVNLDRAAHYTARAVDGAHGIGLGLGHILRKRSAPLLAPASAWSHTARVDWPAARLAAPWGAPLGVAPLAHAGVLGPAGVLGNAGLLARPALLGHGALGLWLYGHQSFPRTTYSTMFKLVVLCAFLAVGAAEPEPEPKPGTFIAAPFQTYAATAVLSPSTTTITKQASSVVHPSPYYVSSPLVYSHFIKKRSPSPGAFSYIAPSAYSVPTYGAYPLPYAGAYAAPLYNSAPILPAAAALPYATTHLIKKRSAPLFPSSYIAPASYAATTPYLASTYSAPVYTAPVLSQPIISQPLLSTHFIKKRSAPIFPAVSTYLAPSSYSHQSRIDLQSAGPLYTYPAYSQPIAYSHVY